MGLSNPPIYFGLGRFARTNQLSLPAHWRSSHSFYLARRTTSHCSRARMRIICASVVCLLAFVVAAALAAPYPCTYTSPSTNNKVREWFVPRPAAWAWTCEYIHIAPSIVSISMTCRTCGATVARARKTTRLPGMSTAPSSTCTRDVCLLPTFAQRLIVSRDSTLMLAQEHLWPDSRHQQIGRAHV